MTNNRSATNGHEINSADARRGQIRLTQAIFAGAAAVATFALFSAVQPGEGGTATASASAPSGPQTAPSMGGGGGFAGSRVIAVDDNTNPSSGDIFTQNAQDQSTA
jgi:hypothetical protein